MLGKFASVLLLLASTALNAALLERVPVVMVFHENDCSQSEAAIEHYLGRVESLGYQPVSLCTQGTSIADLRNAIATELFKVDLAFNQVTGINLFGDVLSDRLSPALSSELGQPVHLENLLAFDQVKLVYQGDQISDIIASQIPSPNRWVAHSFQERDEPSQDLSSHLLLASQQLSQGYSMYSMSNGAFSRLNMTAQLLEIGRQPPPLMGAETAIKGMLTAPTLWVIAGLGRIHGGYSFWNRYQTTGDYFGSPIIDIGSTLIFLTSTYYLTQGLFQDSAESQWKRIVLSPPLDEDGLTTAASTHEK